MIILPVAAVGQVVVDKSADPTSLPQPGGNFTFSVVITNPSPLSVTITSLTDDVYGDLNDAANPNVTVNTCAGVVGTVLAPSPGPGNTFSCSFVGNFTGVSGDSETDTVTVEGVDEENNAVTDEDDAVVNIGPPPSVAVDKTATPTSLPEPGGTFTFNVLVTNPSTLTLEITGLTDNIHGDIGDPGNTGVTDNTCPALIGTTLAPAPGPGDTASCSFRAVFTGNAFDTETDTVTVEAVDEFGNVVTDTDDATITLTDVLPVISVDKSANPAALPEPGGTFTFNVTITNHSVEPVTITSIRDDIYHTPPIDSPARPGSTCDELIGVVLPVGGSASCTFTGEFFGTAGQTQTDVVTGTAVDDEGNVATDDDDATVAILANAPAIQVEKSGAPPSLPQPGGTFTFTVRVSNIGNTPLTVTSVKDSVHTTPPIDSPARPGSTCDELIGRVLQPGQSATCTFTGDFFGNPGDSETNVVTVIGQPATGPPVADDDDEVVRITDVLPTVSVIKTAQPGSLPEPGGTFTFTVTVQNTSVEPVTITSVKDSVHTTPPIDSPARPGSTCDELIGVVLQPGQSATCTFTGDFFGNAGASETNVVTGQVRDSQGNVAQDSDDAVVTLTDVPPTIEVTKTPSPESRPAPGGEFTFRVVVINTSFEPVLLTSLIDSIYGNLHGRGTCTVGVTIAAGGGTYSCEFTVTFTGNAGDTERNVVVAEVVDDDGSRARAEDDAVVRITPAPPAAPAPAPPVPRVPVTGFDTLPAVALAASLITLGAMVLRMSPASGLPPRRKRFGGGSPG